MVTQRLADMSGEAKRFKMKINRDLDEDSGLLVLSFNVDSDAAEFLNSIEQQLGSGGRVEGARRTMSEPAPVFHLSIRSYC